MTSQLYWTPGVGQTDPRNVRPLFQPGSFVELFLLEDTMANICTLLLKPPWALRQERRLLEPFISSVKFSSVAQSCLTLQTHGLQHTRPLCPSPTNSWSLFKHMSIESVMPSSHLILCRPLLLPPSILPSIRVFSNESVLHIIWPKYWSFSFSISPSNEYSGLISFKMDWLDLHVIQGTLKSLLQHHSSKASILRCSAFFIVQLSHPFINKGFNC